MQALAPLGPGFDAFVGPARARPQLWRLAAGMLLAAAAWIVAILLLMRPAPDTAAAALLLYLASFAGLLAGTVAAARLLQGRRPGTLIGPGGFRPRAFLLGVAVVAGLAGASALLPFGAPERQLGLAAWARALPLALPAILLQCAAEEVAFRGYLTQGLAARFRAPLVWWLLPALLFGLLHWDAGQFGADAPLAVLSATVTGLILTDVTLRTGNLSAAIGLHFANNTVALLLVALPSPVSALSLYLLPEPGPGGLRPLILADLAVTLAAYVAWRAVARRRLHSRDPGSI